MGDTSIEWTDKTWNPVRGCTRKSPGCTNCYAERFAARFSGPSQPYEDLVRITKSGPRWTGKVRLIEEHLTDPLRWRKPRRVFVNSMSDLFHEDIPDGWIDKVFAVMALAKWHTFQVLTKRPERMREYLTGNPFGWCAKDRVAVEAGELYSPLKAMSLWPGWPLPNVWLGVSVENQEWAEKRIPLLMQTPAAVRFLSCEPLLGPLELDEWLQQSGYCQRCEYGGHPDCANCGGSGDDPGHGLHWVIIGAESGPGARPMEHDWAYQLLADCSCEGVPVFVKQLPGERGVVKDLAQFPEAFRVREFPALAATRQEG